MFIDHWLFLLALAEAYIHLLMFIDHWLFLLALAEASLRAASEHVVALHREITALQGSLSARKDEASLGEWCIGWFLGGFWW